MSLHRRETILVMVVAMLVEVVWSHGTMMKPIQRSSMFRDARFPEAPTNFDDNQLFCGGFQRQYEINGGKCGVCGDPYNDPNPPNEAGGKYANGIIVEEYGQGDVIDVTVRITANHLGYFIFKLCPNNNVTKRATQECMDQHVLQAMGTSDTNLREKYYINEATGDIQLRLQLPADITCTQCVLQWTYNAGNNYGCDENGNCCAGCGNQENFVNCADIAIIPSGAPMFTTRAPTTSESQTITPPSTATASSTTTQLTTETSTTTTTSTTTIPSLRKTGEGCRPTATYMNVPGMTNWCNINCAAGFCPTSHCLCP